MSKVNIDKYKKDVKEALKHSKELVDACKSDSFDIEALKSDLEKLHETFDELRDRPLSPELLEDFKKNRLPKHGACFFELDSIKNNISLIEEFLRNTELKKTVDQIKDIDKKIPTSLEFKILDFENKLIHIKKVADHLRFYLEGFVFDYSEVIEMNETVRYITNEYSELVGMLNKEIYPKINEYRSIISSGRIRGLSTKINDLRREIRLIKNLHIDAYNSVVERVNDQIDVLSGLDNLSDEDKKNIADLTKIDKVNFEVSNYDNVGYMNLLKYDVVINVLNRIAEVKKSIEKNLKGDESIPESFSSVSHVPETKDLYDIIDADLTSLSIKIDDTSSKIVDYFNYDNVTNDIVFSLRGGIVEINASLFAKESNIHSIFNNKYLDSKQKDLLLEKVNKIKGQLVIVEDNLSNLEKKIDTYKNLSNRVMSFAQEVEDFNDFIAGMSDNKASEEHIVHLNEKIDELENKHSEISKSIKSEFEVLNINEDQMNNLNSLMSNIVDKIKISKDEVVALSKFNDKVIYRDDCSVDELEKDLEELFEIINNNDSPIKRGYRKIIDAKFSVCEENISVIEKKLRYLKKYKPEKFNTPEVQEMVERLEKCKTSKDEVSLHSLRKEYRKKCPLHVRVVKSAKHFYKEHKKACLIAAGLAAIALVHATVGPVIIPAIMHGNIMIAGKSAFLRPVFKAFNKVLGAAINARNIDGFWYLASGALINPTCAASSLLKGIAISAGATAIGVAPLIAGVRMLTNKIKRSRNKGTDALSEDKKIKPSKVAKKIISPVVGAARKVSAPVSKAVDYFKKDEVVFDEERINKLMHIYLDDKVDFEKTEDYSPEEKREALCRLRNSVRRKDVRKAGRR